MRAKCKERMCTVERIGKRMSSRQHKREVWTEVKEKQNNEVRGDKKSQRMRRKEE